MSLNQAINHGHEHRKQYRGAKAVDKTCRNHGSCKYCENNRLYQANREAERMKKEEKEYRKHGVDNIGDSDSGGDDLDDLDSQFDLL